MHYSDFLTEKDKKLTVKCTLCAGGRPWDLSTPKYSASNLKKHLERVRSHLKLVAKPSLEKEEDDGVSKPKQQQLDFSRSEVKVHDQ